MRPTRSELEELFRLAVPVVAVQLGMMTLGVVDTIMVGRVSPAHLAAVALGNLYFFGVSVFGQGVLFALDPVISQAVGAGDREGVATPYALFHLQERGVLFVPAGTPVYEGMIVGEYSRDVDLDVNVCREKKLTNMRASGHDEAVRLVPHRPMGLEDGLEWIDEDELVEVTPDAIRLRKKELRQAFRPRGPRSGRVHGPPAVTPAR